MIRRRPYVYKKRIPLEEIARRFWYRVATTEDGCWEWMGGTDRDGYGQMKVLSEGKITTMRAHCVSYMLHRDEIPAGLQLDHLCRNRRCVNPTHLEIVTGSQNNSRSGSPSAMNARKTHCIHGHEFNKQNTRISKEGFRRCRSCERERHKTERQRSLHAAYMRMWVRRKRA